MTNLLEQAISTDDGDRAAKIIQDALGIESDEGGELSLPKKVANRPRAKSTDYRGLVEG